MWLADKVGITGTRNGMTHEQRKTLCRVLIELDAKELHEGDCIGVDAQAVEIARYLGLHVVSHPPLNPKYRAYAPFDVERPLAEYLIRNEQIVNETELLISIPKFKFEEIRSGTWACIRYARKKSRVIFIIHPNGELVKE